VPIAGGRRMATVRAASDTDLHLLRIPLIPFLYLLARNRREVQDVATVVLRQTELFALWPPKAMSKIAITAVRRTYRPGDIIAQQGNAAGQCICRRVLNVCRVQPSRYHMEGTAVW